VGKLNNVREAIAIARECRTILGAAGITLDYPPLRHASNLESVLTYDGHQRSPHPGHRPGHDRPVRLPLTRILVGGRRRTSSAVRRLSRMNVLFITSMSVVAADPPRSRKLFMDALGLPLEKYEADEYYSSDHIPGSKHFGVWPLSQAAEACFGTPAVARRPGDPPGVNRVRGRGRSSRRRGWQRT